MFREVVVKNNTKLSQLIYPIIVISLCAAFLFYKYVLQIYPTVITGQLMREFQLSGAGLGNLAATFYYSYMITQLFVGVILDRFSPRWLNAAAIFICALGLFIFAQTTTLLYAQLSRALMGVGVAFATVAYMKLAALWFKPKAYAFIGGLLATAAMAGAVFGEAPLAVIIDHWGWRETLVAVSYAGFGLALLFLLIVRDKGTQPVNRASHKTDQMTGKDFLTVLKNKQNWLLTFYSGLAFSPVAVFGGLWGNPFLQDAYHIDRAQAGSLVSLVFIGLGIGSPIIGIISDYVRSRRNLMISCTFIGCAAITLVLYWHTMPTWLLGTLLFIFGFTLGAFMLSFAIGKELNDLRLIATVVAMINASEAFLDALTEPAIGKLLDLTWDGKMVDGIRVFSQQSYQLALSVLPLYLFIAAVLLFWVKEPQK